MGAIYRNGTLYGSTNRPSVTLTKAEYDALAQSGSIVEGVLYYVTDENENGFIDDTTVATDTTYSSNKIEKLTKIDTSLTTSGEAADAKATGDLINDLIDSCKDLEDMQDSMSDYFAGYNDMTSPSYLSNFWSGLIPANCGDTFYFSRKYERITTACYDSSKTYLGNFSINTEDDGKFTVPSTYSATAYISIPMRTSEFNTILISKEELSSKGNCPTVYKLIAGSTTPEEVTFGESATSSYNAYSTHPNYSKSVFDDSSWDTSYQKWYAYYAKTDYAKYNSNGGFHIIAIDFDNGYIMAISMQENRLIVFTDAQSFVWLQDAQTVTINPILTHTFTDASSTSGTEITESLYGDVFVYKHSGTSIKISNGSESTAISYSGVNSLLAASSLSDLTMDDFTPCSGVVVFNGSSSYFCTDQNPCVTFRSTESALGISNITVTPKLASQWDGKVWYAYGTSMTDGSTGYTSYTPRLASLAGMELHNYGLGGSGIIPSLHPSDCTKTRVMRTTDGKTAADLITVEVIPNDMTGTLGEVTDTSDDTFCGNLNQIIQYLQTNTTAQIVILVATRERYNSSSSTETYPPESEAVTTWLEWVDATAEVCRRNGVQCWDGSSNTNLVLARVGDTSTTYIKDNIHLTSLGAYNLAQYYLHQLENLPNFYTAIP